MNKLKPCPFCGQRDLSINEDYSDDEPKRVVAFYVRCNVCHARGRNHYPIGWCESEAEAIDAWNHRGSVRSVQESVRSVEVTEVERVAMTLLDKADPDHPCLVAWVQALLDNPDEYRGIDDYSLSQEAQLSGLKQNGFAQPVRYHRFGEDTLAVKLIDERGVEDWQKYRGCGLSDQREQTSIKIADRAIYLLADALVEYRRRGRPVGDQETIIMGLGSPLLRVTTSLAARIVEYHQAIVDSIYEYYDDLVNSVKENRRRLQMEMDKEVLVSISLEEYKRLKWALYCLESMEANNVDNWEGYQDSVPDWDEFLEEFEAGLQESMK